MTEVTTGKLKVLIPPILQVIIDHADELTSLDQAIGDGDHGINMKRGAEKILGEMPEISRKPMHDALTSMGMALVMSVGGASGPLFGSLLMEMGKSLGSRDLTQNNIVECFSNGIEAVKKRGRSDAGQKTMLDVLIPVLAVLKKNESGPDLYSEIKKTVAASEDKTIGMLALKGRASYLGERSIGHMDPGARTCGLVISEICHILEVAGNEY